MVGSENIPKKVHSLQDAITVAQILEEAVWALVYGSKTVYRVYPGGRIENHGELRPMVFEEEL